MSQKMINFLVFASIKQELTLVQGTIVFIFACSDRKYVNVKETLTLLKKILLGKPHIKCLLIKEQ